MTCYLIDPCYKDNIYQYALKQLISISKTDQLL
jgi:hypothetical protein